MKYSYVYLMANKTNTVLYTGVTADLLKRVYQHKQKLIPGFTMKYNVDKLVYFEIFEDITEAIKREKQIKGGSRPKKIDLITRKNPEFRDLYDEIASSVALGDLLAMTKETRGLAMTKGAGRIRNGV